MESRDLSLLLALDALLQEGNVTLAGRRLGLSTPAASHALARIRERLGDPLLVRAGRSMTLTPRAEELRPLVRSLVEEATRVLSPARSFEPHALSHTFTIFATDHALLVIGKEVDRLVRAQAPNVSLRFLPSVVDDWMPLRDGTADLSVCGIRAWTTSPPTSGCERCSFEPPVRWQIRTRGHQIHDAPGERHASETLPHHPDIARRATHRCIHAH